MTTHDDVRAWELTLCGACLDKQYAKHLDLRDKAATQLLGAAAGFAILGILALLNAQYQLLPMPDGEMRFFAALIMAIVTTALAFGGAIALLLLPGAVGKKLRSSRALAAYRADRTLADQAIDDAFAEAGRTALKERKGDLAPPSGTAESAPAAFGKLEPLAAHPAKEGDEGTYRVKHRKTEVLKAADHPDAAIPADWATRYVELDRVTDKARLAAAVDKESRGAGTWFLYFAVLLAMLLIGSALSWKNGAEVGAFLLVVPLAIFPAVGAVIAWFIDASTVRDYKRLFGGLWEFASAKRFLVRRVAGIVLVVACAIYLVHTRSAYIAAHPLKLYDRAGVTFGSPREWRKLSDEEIERLRKHYEGRVIGAFEPEDDALFLVTIERSRRDPSGLFDDRRRQIDEAAANGEVTQLHRLESTEINGHPAVYLDVNRRDSGRGRKVDLRVSGAWVGVALVLPRGDMEDYDELFGEILNTVEYTPSHD